MKRFLVIYILGFGCLLRAASAQTDAAPNAPAPANSQLPAIEAPPAGIWPPPEAPRVALHLSAHLSASDSQPVHNGVKWRVYEQAADANGNRKIVAQSNDATPQFQLPPGSYFVHAAYGLASATRQISLSGRLAHESLILNAGGLKVIGLVGDAAAPTSRIGINIAIYIPERGNSEAKLVLPKGKANETICLPEGAYHIVSTLYDLGSAVGSPVASNSMVTADLRVPAGKLIVASLKHKVAVMTIKLVNAPGGEALANTSFSILTPGGDVIRELIGAFPALLLAEGEYVVIARHEGETYQSQFKVQGGMDRDVEIIAKK